MQEKDRLEREGALRDLELWWEAPIRILGVIWLILLMYELMAGTNRLVEILVYTIWGMFILDFAARLALATDKRDYLKHNVLTGLSLVVPAVRFLAAWRLLHLLRLTRGIRLATLIGSLNRGMHVFRAFLSENKTGYVIGFSVVVALVGAAGMLAFEQSYPGSAGFETYGDSLWWTAMLLTTVGSQAWPESPEGRLLCFVMALYSFGVFGYITAALASFLLGKKRKASYDNANPD